MGICSDDNGTEPLAEVISALLGIPCTTGRVPVPLIATKDFGLGPGAAFKEGLELHSVYVQYDPTVLGKLKARNSNRIMYRIYPPIFAGND